MHGKKSKQLRNKRLKVILESEISLIAVFFGQIKCKKSPDSDVLVDNFHKVVDGSVDNAKAYVHG